MGKYRAKQSYAHDAGFCSSEDAPSNARCLISLKDITLLFTGVWFFRTNVPLGKPFTCIYIWGDLLL